MRKGGHLLPVFCACWWLLHTDARNQQTFVVRYKNGEHTVPVTVVLDFKKQTEYVINMSPRAPTKTVTLYDFKQKTIAYKDLTNRECFLGHLTHETLRDETDALANIQTPVERQPKVLSLDPQRAALTPTEIRNAAGLRTAVFCGKMNTWLILPTHSLQKREVEERTFHRHGYHTVRYSHFGRETRRRYSARRKDASKIPTWRPENAKSASEKSALPQESPFFSQVLYPSPLETVHNVPHTPRLHPPEINGKEPLHLEPIFAANPGKTVSSLQPAIAETSGYRGETVYPAENKGKNTPDFRETKVVDANEKAPFVPKYEPVDHSIPGKSEIMATKSDANQQSTRNFSLYGDHREREQIPPDNSLQRKLDPKVSDFILEDTDLSSHVPKTTERSLPITQPNFDGFFHLGPSEPFLYNSYFIPLEGKEHDESLTKSYPSFYHPKGIDDEKQQWSDVSQTAETIASTDFPSLTTSDYKGATLSPTFWNSFPDIGNLKNTPANTNNLNSAPQEIGPHSRSWAGDLLQPIISEDENTLNGHLTTDDPSLPNQRQPGVRSGELLTFSRFDRNLQEANERQNSGIQEGASSQQIRLQNILRNYKPDQIVIDVEKIPTQHPPESTLSFQAIYPNLSKNDNGRKSEQTSGDTWRIRQTNFPSRKRHDVPSPRGNESNLSHQRARNSNIGQPSSHTLSNPVYNIRGSLQLDRLPPGVSIHPQAPYAVHSNGLLPVLRERTPHRQRHHRQCCRGKAKSCCRSCCKGGHKCCSPAKRPKQASLPQQGVQSGEDQSRRCQEEKMCRTLYESTQQVMVCRNAKMDGC